MICSTCLTTAAPRASKERPGSTPAVLFLVFAVAGIFVKLLWLLAGLFFLAAVARAITHAVGGKVTLTCPACQAAAMVPLDTPRGQQLFASAGAPAPAAAPPSLQQ